MLTSNSHSNLLFLFFSVCMISCNTMKNVPQDDHLFTGSSVVSAEGKMTKTEKSDLSSIAKPEPNSSFLGLKIKLGIYNAIKEPKKKKGIIYNIKHKWGEAPVLLSQARPSSTEQRMQQHLFSIGYFRSSVTHRIEKKKRTASIVYEVTPGTRYKIRNIILPSDSSHLSVQIRAAANESLLKPGQYCELSVLSSERKRLDMYLKEKGYFYFSADDILFRTDTLHQGEADVYLTVKPTTSPASLKVWTLGKITIYGNYRAERDSFIRQQTAEISRQYDIIDPKHTYRPSLFERALFLKQGEIYERGNHSVSIERLMNLNTFKFVKMSFIPVNDSDLLKTYIYLTPAKKRALRLELSGYTKSNNFVGSEIGINFRNVNWLRGAEILEAKMSAGFDTQIGGDQLSSNAYSYTGEINLYIPKMLVPFRVKPARNSFMRKTIFSTGVEFVRRPELYTLQSLRFSMGYTWKIGKATEHTFRIVNINAVSPSNITPKFDSILAGDVSLRASFERQLIIGMRYDYRYNNTYRADKKFNWAFDGTVMTSGNFTSLFVKKDGDTVGSKKLLGLPLSQFVSLQADLRGYLRINRSLDWVNRIIAAVAFAYGNSAAIPYSEQFAIGGSSSLRGFRARTLGPGSFYTSQNEFEANESGDIKVELNSELRVRLTSLIRLGVYVEGGNIWYRKEPPDKPGSGLDKGDLFGEMAVSTGLGLRFDASVLVIRFDFGMPIRKPWYPKGSRWVFNEIDLGNKQWRQENLVLNIGIGYPF